MQNMDIYIKFKAGISISPDIIHHMPDHGIKMVCANSLHSQQITDEIVNIFKCILYSIQVFA